MAVPQGCARSVARSLAHINEWLRLYLGGIRDGQAADPSTCGPEFTTTPTCAKGSESVG